MKSVANPPIVAIRLLMEPIGFGGIYKETTNFNSGTDIYGTQLNFVYFIHVCNIFKKSRIGRGCL